MWISRQPHAHELKPLVLRIIHPTSEISGARKGSLSLRDKAIAPTLADRRSASSTEDVESQRTSIDSLRYYQGKWLNRYEKPSLTIFAYSYAYIFSSQKLCSCAWVSGNAIPKGIRILLLKWDVSGIRQIGVVVKYHGRVSEIPWLSAVRERSRG